MPILLAALLLVAPPAVAADDTSGSVPAPKKVKKVCRTVTRPGSHIDQTVCRTPEEWNSQTAGDDTGSLPVMPGDRVATGRALGFRGPMDTRPPGP